MPRLAPKKNVIRQLFAHSGNQCAFPGCYQVLIDDDGYFLGQICHIEAAEPGGERYNETMNDEDRRAYSNLVLFCYAHHIKTNNVEEYKPEHLKKIKEEHEVQFKGTQYVIPVGIEEKLIKAIEDRLSAIHQTALEQKALAEKGLSLHDETLGVSKQILAFLQSKGGNGSVSFDDSKIYSERLTLIHGLKDRGKIETALEEMQRFQSDNWEKIDVDLRYKVLANLAVILFDLGRRSEAGEVLLRLEKLNFRSASSLAYLALGFALLNQREDFQRLLQDPLLDGSVDSNLWVGYLLVYKDTLPPEQLASTIPQAALATPQVAFTLGEIFVDAGNQPEGFRLLDRSLASIGSAMPERWRIQALVAERKLEAVATVEKIVLKSFSPVEILLIRQCQEMLSQSWEYVRRTELSASSWHIVMNRGICHQILDDPISAEYDLEEAWKVGQNFTAYRNLMYEYLNSRKVEKARHMLGLPGIESLAEYNHLYHIFIEARVLTLEGTPELAANFLLAKIDDFEGEDRLSLLDLIAVGHIQNNGFEEALPQAERIINEFPENSTGYLLKAICVNRMGRSREALSHLLKAKELTTKGRHEEWKWLQLAEEFYWLKEYEQTLSCLEQVKEYPHNKTMSNKLILANFQIGRYKIAEELCKKRLDEFKGDALANEVLLRIFINTGNSAEAAAVLENYLIIGVANSLDHFRWLGVRYYKRLGRKDDMLRLLLSIETPNYFSVEEQFEMVELLNECGESEKADQLAYEIRIENLDNYKVHEEYYAFMTVRPEIAFNEKMPQKIEAETAFVVEDDNGEIRTYFITNDSTITGGGILRTKDRLAQIALGKSIGEPVIVRATGQEKKLTITAILSKYAYACQESRQLLDTKYLAQTSMVRFREGERGLEQLKQFMLQQGMEQEEHGKKTLNLYNTDMATIGMLATHMKRSTIETWMWLMAEDVTAVQCYDSPEEGELKWAVSENRPIILELTGLLTATALLDRWDLLDSFPNDFYITQATLDELLHYRRQWDTGQPRYKIFVQDGELRKIALDQEMLTRQKEWLDRLIHWCRTYTTIRFPAQIEVKKKKYQEIAEMFGDAAFESLLLTEELQGALLSDDAKLKAFALGEFGLHSFSIYQTLFFLSETQKISIQEMRFFSMTLARSNYIYIALTGDDLWELFDESGFRVRAPFTRGLRGLLMFDTKYTANAIASFAKQVYLNIFVVSTRENVLQHVLRGIKKRNDYDRIKELILRIIENEFFLLPQHQSDFAKLILSI